MKKVIVYDWFVRVFHWLFAFLFLTSFVIAKAIDDESPLYSWHMLSGIFLGGLVVLRGIWFVIGTDTAKLSGFALHPRQLLAYLRGIVTGSNQRWIGHNPASSWAALIMMLMAVGLAFTGYLMTSGPNKEDFEDIHELLANGFMITVIAHISGVVLHTIRHRDPIGLSMIHGAKTLNESDLADPHLRSGIGNARPWAGVLLVVLMTAFGATILKGFDATSGKLTLAGINLQLSEMDDEGDKERDEDDEDED